MRVFRLSVWLWGFFGVSTILLFWAALIRATRDWGGPDAQGRAFLWPTFGGVVYNVSVGDSAFGWSGDCVHPGVSISHPDANKNRGLNVFACVGNEAAPPGLLA